MFFMNNDIISSFNDSIRSMVLALDLREKDMAFHCYRVTEYAIALAQHMGVPSSDIRSIAHGALLHDIGKIGIPDNILFKEGKLTTDEWDVMKKHPIYGFDLIKQIGPLNGASNIVLSHHERYDGKGYPNGIRGDEIPLGTRIFSVADALDAIMSRRQYKKRESFETARNIIIEGAGTQFDPGVVEKFSEISIDTWIGLRYNVESMGHQYLIELFPRIA